MTSNQVSPEVGLPKGSPPIKAALKVSPDLRSFHNSPCCLYGSFQVLCPPPLGVSHKPTHSTFSGCGFYPPFPDTQNREEVSIQPVRAAQPRRSYDYLLNRSALSGRVNAPYMGLCQNRSRARQAPSGRPCLFVSSPPAARAAAAHPPPWLRISSLMGFRSGKRSLYWRDCSTSAEMKRSGTTVDDPRTVPWVIPGVAVGQ